ncbi:ImmA/IrrE family metallo-endopeptidase [Reichenbachiella sp.]|uniref:ImmA/IrrE family metallo-endopeptidase n=1 Tax=Reichenbachiella sp. TaxID=2184521 RepID=UPI003B5ACE9B
MTGRTLIQKSRKEFIEELAESVAEDYCPKNVIQPEIIADENGITYSYNNYGLCFDGMLEHRFGKFHIFISLNNRLVHESSPRTRFTFAHELGHYFIDEHRVSLKNGKTPSHPSYNNFQSNNPIELEADLFAACLLMPKSRFVELSEKKIFSFNLVDMISKKFNTSLSATLIRYASINSNHPICIICSQNGRVKWHRASNDFGFKYLKGYDENISPWTVAGEYYTKKIKRISDKEEVEAKEWYKIGEDYNRTLYEKCIYADTQNLVMSVLWED